MKCDAKHKTRTGAWCDLEKGHASYHRWRPRGSECEHVEVRPGSIPECLACGCIIWPEGRIVAPAVAPKAALVFGDDWTGLYVNGELRLENSTIHVADVIEALGLECETVTADEDWLTCQGSLPKALADVRRRESARSPSATNKKGNGT